MPSTQEVVTNIRKPGVSKKPVDRGAVKLKNGKLCDVTAVANACLELKLSTGPHSSMQECVDAIRAYAKKKKADMACDKCGEVSTSDTAFCPFCGATEVEVEHEVIVVEHAMAGKLAVLETIEKKIHALEKDTRANIYDMGVLIAEVRDNHLYGARKYKTFKEWAIKHTGLSPEYATQIAKVTSSFSREEYFANGPTKLITALSVVSKEERKALVAEIKDKNLTREEVQNRVATANEVKSPARKFAPVAEAKPNGAAPHKEPRKEAPAKHKNTAITAGISFKQATVELRSLESGRPLQKYRPGAYFEHAVGDSLVVRFSPVFNKEGELVGGKAITVRVEE